MNAADTTSRPTTSRPSTSRPTVFDQTDLGRQPAGRPNVVVVLLDDVGFGAPGTFGGPVATPTLDHLAARGLRYNRFHTTAICSPTRASLLSGRDCHVTGVGTVLNSAWDHPSYNGVWKAESASVARVLQGEGYATACIGKWHLAPPWECSQAGPFTRWPTGQGFDHFYGFLGGETQQFEPTLYEGTAPAEPKGGEGYHLTEDLVDRSIGWIRQQRNLDPERPFFLYLAPGATHAPLQVPRRGRRSTRAPSPRAGTRSGSGSSPTRSPAARCPRAPSSPTGPTRSPPGRAWARTSDGSPSG